MIHEMRVREPADAMEKREEDKGAGVSGMKDSLVHESDPVEMRQKDSPGRVGLVVILI
jgi:hypothetical protein